MPNATVFTDFEVFAFDRPLEFQIERKSILEAIDTITEGNFRQIQIIDAFSAPQ